jgi:hypothetical protein
MHSSLSIFIFTIFAAAATAGATRHSGPSGAEAPPPHPLVWDAITKTYDAPQGSTSVDFAFSVTNRSSEPVRIDGLISSCGCTAMDLPDLPWHLAPGASRVLQGVVETKRKEGRLTKTMTITSTAGPQELVVVVNIPASPDEDPAR